MTIHKSYPYLLIILSIVGLLASAILMNDTVKLANNPDVILPCNINPLLSCTSINTKWQSHVFGFPNPILGITAFAMLIALGLGLVYEVIDEELGDGSKVRRARKYFWTLVNYGTLASFIFVMWFFYESVFKIGSLCLYCMIVWTVTWPTFLYTTIWNLKEKHFSLNKINKQLDGFLFNNHIQTLLTGYVVVVFIILFHFRDFFFS